MLKKRNHAQLILRKVLMRELNAPETASVAGGTTDCGSKASVPCDTKYCPVDTILSQRCPTSLQSLLDLCPKTKLEE